MNPLAARLACLCAVAAAAPAWAGPVSMKSPDGRLTVSLSDADGRLRYDVKRGDRPLLLPSALGVTVDNRDLGARATLGEARVTDGRDAFKVVGVHAKADLKYREAVIPVRGGTPATDWTLEVRAYDDGVAVRYRVPGDGKRRIDGEATDWRLPPDATLWFQTHTWSKDYEARYQKAEPGRVPAGQTIASPVLLKLPADDGYAFVTEANLVDYNDIGLVVRPDNVFGAFFHNDSGGFEIEGAITTPWRVTLLTPDLDRLVNCDVIQSLCPPPPKELADADWIKPGRAAWHWRVTGRPKYAEQKQWVDWAAALGFEYYLVDDGWRDWKANGKNAWALLREVVEYGKTKNVKIMAWVHSQEVTKPDERLAYMKKAQGIGIVGLKIDFMRPANVEWVRWYDETLRDAAAHKLMIDYHGALKPTGRERTWPNELTREGIGGREQGKLPGLHDTTVPFLRFVQGHADYTPTEFRKDELKGNTVAKELAQAVVYTSPLQCYSGVPKDYLASPALDVIKSMPSVWDQTVVLPGSEVGEVAGFARRSGGAWYVGVVNGSTARTMKLALSFLGDTRYDATLLADTPGDETKFDAQKKTLGRGDTLDLKMSKDGGFVARLTPAGN